MKSLVKTFLVLNLILCAGVLGVSIKTFRDREIVKARTVIHRQQLGVIAEKLEWGKEQAWEEAGDRKPGNFVLPSPASLEEMGSFTDQLKTLTELADQRVAQLTEQYEDLVKTQATLEETQTELATRKQELTDARARVAQLEINLGNSKSSLQNTRNQIATLTRENESLQEDVNRLDKQITDQQTLISQVRTELELRTSERNKAKKLYEECMRGPSGDQNESGDWHQATAKILAVEPEWNYVVINRGEVDTLPMFLEAFVHRGDTFVGKIRVMQVDRMVAIAEILTDTLTPGMTVQSGDTIFF